MQKVSLCITILNEAQTIEQLLDAVLHQTVLPDELVIVDGGSTDTTTRVITDWQKQHRPTFSIHTIEAAGNRSLGRNTAILHAKNNWIAITDAGCIPHADWLEQLLLEQKRSKKNVVAGYYDALPHTPLEEAMVPYVLVMPDRVDARNFLPATRSLLLDKSLWQQVGGFDLSLSDNEDYAFAKKINEITPISFAEAAKVSWIPRQTIQQFYTMIFRFARGDIEAKILRPKVALVFVRYILAITVTAWLISESSIFSALLFVVFAGGVYAIWAISKNQRYTPNGWYWLPALQYIADCAVMFGSVSGVWRRLQHEHT